MNHIIKPIGSIAIIPLNEPRLLTTERIRRAARLGKERKRVPIKYATFYSVVKAIGVDNDWRYIGYTEQQLATYSRIWGEPITRIRLVLETIFTFRDSMPPTITKWGDAIPYLECTKGLALLRERTLYTGVELLQHPYVDRNRSKRISISRSNKRGEVILSHHIKQWSHSYGPIVRYLYDDSDYYGRTSSIEAAEFITRGTLPTTWSSSDDTEYDSLPTASAISYANQDNLASSMAFSR